jgi:hypothetical protein
MYGLRPDFSHAEDHTSTVPQSGLLISAAGRCKKQVNALDAAATIQNRKKPTE